MFINEILSEIANTSYNFKLNNYIFHPMFSEWEYTFETNDTVKIKYKVNLSLRSNDNTLIITFGSLTTDNDLTKIGPSWTDNITNTGNAFRVFSTVLLILKECLKQIDSDGLKADMIEFASKTIEPSRIKLYIRFVDNINKYLPDWKLLSVKNGSNYLNFKLKKK